MGRRQDKGASARIADLELALDLALAWLGRLEPPDSRAVSNEFVAMASIRCDAAGDRVEECRQIIRDAIKEDAAPRQLLTGQDDMHKEGK